MTQLVDSRSPAGLVSELDLFSVPPSQVALNEGYLAEFYPQNAVTNTGPYRFLIPADAYMLDLSKKLALC